MPRQYQHFNLFENPKPFISTYVSSHSSEYHEVDSSANLLFDNLVRQSHYDEFCDLLPTLGFNGVRPEARYFHYLMRRLFPDTAKREKVYRRFMDKHEGTLRELYNGPRISVTRLLPAKFTVAAIIPEEQEADPRHWWLKYE